MCGIIGHIAPQGHIPDREAVEKGCFLLRHRGPNGSGIVGLQQACLGHRRLSIIDLEGSPQPWTSNCGRYHIVFNGEIYNYLELRKELEHKEFVFRSNGDTEVLLNSFIAYGHQCLNKLNGMFAFAIWDIENKSLFIARDRIGKKPLYYSLNNKGLIFASEIKALSSFKFISSNVDISAVNDFFAHQFIGEERTIYSEIKKLPPAHTLTFKDNRLTINRYWHPPLPTTNKYDEESLCEELYSLAKDAVGIRLRSDVPLGAFLSGGIDSSLIVHHIRELGYPLLTFTIGFKEKSFDESDNARYIADKFRTAHRSKYIDDSILDKLTDCLNSFDEPFADPSVLPTWFLCQFAKSEITVALSGDGIDEIFAGYSRYYARNLARYLLPLPKCIKIKLLGKCIEHLPESTSYYGKSVIKKFKLFHTLLRKIEESPGDPLAQTFTLSERQSLFYNSPIDAQTFNYIQKYDLNSIDPVSAMMHIDQLTYLPEDILTKVDRISMRHGLEVRSPFLDYRIIEFACRLPIEYKIRGSTQKYLLRKCYSQKMPKHIYKLPKHGFSVPLGDWFKSFLRDPFQQIVFDSHNSMLNRQEVLRLWNEHQGGKKDHGFKLWSIFAFCEWEKNRIL